MNTPKTFEEWWEAHRKDNWQSSTEALGSVWHAAQAAVANPWREYRKEKPVLDNPMGAKEIIAEVMHTDGTVYRCVCPIYLFCQDENSTLWREGDRIAWQYLTPSPFSLPVKSEAEEAWYENREHLEHAITHAAFCEVFNLVLEKGKDKP